MIRNVVMGRLRDAPTPEAAAADREQLQRGLDGIASLQLPGLLATLLGTDAGLRDGSWSFAITNDWVDAESYRAYDVDAEHNEYRALIGGVCSQLARVQFEV